MEALKTIPYLFLILAIAGIIAGASVLVVSKFSDTMTECDTAGTYYRTSTGYLINSTVQTGVNKYSCLNSSEYITGTVLRGNLTPEFKTTVLTQEGLSSGAEQFPVIAIIAVMAIIIGVLSSVFVYLNFFR